MTFVHLALKNIRYRSLQSSISIFLFAFGALLISLIAQINTQITEKFENNLAGINLVVGAKGSPLQMILCNMYHIDAPTGNISVADAKAFFNPRHPLIASATPLSLGDNHKGYRIVGTDDSFLELYDLTIGKGHLWDHSMEVLVGSRVAQELDLKLGDSFYSGHGLIDDDAHLHDDGSPFVVVGILDPSQSVADQLILTATPSVWEVHQHEESSGADHSEDAHHEHEDHDGHDHEHHHHNGHDHDDHHHSTGQPLANFDLLEHPNEEITSVLLTFKGRNIQTLNFQRNINENTDLQAATPAIEISRIFNLLGFGFDLLRYLAIAIMLVSGISVFLSLLSSLQSRIPELALQRALGGRRLFLFGQIVAEGAILGFIGALLGLIFARICLYFVGSMLSDQYKYSFDAFAFSPMDVMILIISVVIGLVAAMIPAIKAYRTEISKSI